VTFKNVGQGDSIILEWLNPDGLLHVGIIDCKIAPNNTCPVVDYLRSLSDYVLAFVLFTHPHKDHYDGSLDLIDYIKMSGTIVLNFASTFRFSPESIRKFTQREADLFNRFLDAKKSIDDHVKNSLVATAAGALKLNGKELVLTYLAPSEIEVEKFQDRITFEWSEKFTKGNTAANYLSTILIVEGCKDFILLTSDADKSLFLDSRGISESFYGKVRLAQVPHHGAAHNYDDEFWKALPRSPDCIAVVSVGSNRYGHPDPNVLRSLSSNGYRVALTNVVNGAKTYMLDLVAEERTKLRILEDDTVPWDREPGQDVVFYLDKFF